jgi:DNA-binding NtrC family response regulator
MSDPHVLLMEDDSALRSVLLELFLDEQLDVTVCDSLAAIYAALEDHPRAVVVTDSWTRARIELGPPEQEALLALDAVATVIFTTGRRWAATGSPLWLGNVTLLNKPYDVDDLMLAIRAGARERVAARV